MVLPLLHDKPKLDLNGESFRFALCEEMDRFDTVLYLEREEEPLYRLYIY